MKYLTKERIKFWSCMLLAAIVGSVAGRLVDILALVVRLVTKPSAGDVLSVLSIALFPFLVPLLLGNAGSVAKRIAGRLLESRASESPSAPRAPPDA